MKFKNSFANQGRVAESIRIAAKIGFLPKPVWREFVANDLSESWQRGLWRKLVSSKIFETTSFYRGSKTDLVLSTQGKKLAQKSGLHMVGPANFRNIEHDSDVLRIALSLEKSGLIQNWFSEKEIQAGECRDLIGSFALREQKFPDLLLRLQVPGEPYWMAVELERTQKSFGRYQNFVMRYSGISKINSVLVVSQTLSIERVMHRIMARLFYPMDQRPILFASSLDFLKDPGKIEIRFTNGITSFEDVVRSLRTKREAAA